MTLIQVVAAKIFLPDLHTLEQIHFKITHQVLQYLKDTPQVQQKSQAMILLQVPLYLVINLQSKLPSLGLLHLQVPQLH